MVCCVNTTKHIINSVFYVTANRLVLPFQYVYMHENQNEKEKSRNKEKI